MLHRVFHRRPGAQPRPLAVPRRRQGTGRHDEPEHYTALYLAREPEGAVAEAVQAFRGRRLTDDDLARADGTILALATYDDRALPSLVDLDDPAVLVARGWRPSQVATRDRSVTQPIALALFESGAVGCSWWSTLDAAWTNVTLFGERVEGRLRLVEAAALSVRHPALVAAADRLGIDLPRRPGPN